MEEKLEAFRSYLQSQGHRLTTISSYSNAADRFMKWLAKEGLKIEELSYAELLKWVGWRQGLGAASKTINQEIGIINKLYGSLNLPSPCGELRIKGQQHKILSEGGLLLSSEALDSLYANYGAGGLSGKRNKAILGLYIYQGIRKGELEQLRIADVDLDRSMIRLPETGMGNSRILDLLGVQLVELQDYIYQVRPLLNTQKTDRLFISMGTGNKLGNSLSYLMKSLKKSNPKLKSLTQIRQSRISYWLEKHDIRTVQYMAGHRNVSSTQRYQTTNLESLQERLDEIHPLNRS